MRTSVLFFAVLIVALAVTIHAAPPKKSPNSNVNLMTQGLKQKLCDRDQKLRGGSRSTAKTNSNRRTRKATEGPSCSTYNTYSFERLIQENKKLLRPVANRRY